MLNFLVSVIGLTMLEWGGGGAKHDTTPLSNANKMVFAEAERVNLYASYHKYIVPLLLNARILRHLFTCNNKY